MSALRALVAAELAQPVAPAVAALAGDIVREHGAAVAAILFYGACLREPEREGMLDFYVLVDDDRDFHGRGLQALANRLLPPTILYREHAGTRAKLAVISRPAFARRVRPGGRDTTVWARFCQPAALVHARDAEAAGWAAGAVADAVATAAGFAARLGPEEGTPRDFWCALFRHTYAAELRIERGEDRGALIYERAAGRFDRLLEPALAEAGIAFETTGGGDADGPVRIRPRVGDRGAARRAWRRRARGGRALNLARLVKAAFTFAPHADYLAWKVERHTGRPLELTPFERRHPVLAAPSVLWRLYRHRALR